MIPIHFAPLQGYTEAPYRNFHASAFGGIEACYTPFIRLEKGELRKKELRDIDPANNTAGQLIPQLIASTPTEMQTIADLLIERGYRKIDINIGCPFPLVTGKRKGAGLLPYPDEVEAMLKAVGQYPDVSFSVKMRLGLESASECLALIPILNELPLAHITMHPRLGKQQYKGTVDMEGFAAFYNACTRPLVYNGDLETIDDIRRIEDQYPKLAGVMIGRGLLANPALAIEYRDGQTLAPEEMMRRVKELHTGVFNHYRNYLEGGELQLLSKMKPFWEYLLPDANRKLKKAIHKSSRLSTYEQAVREIFGSADFPG